MITTSRPVQSTWPAWKSPWIADPRAVSRDCEQRPEPLFDQRLGGQHSQDRPDVRAAASGSRAGATSSWNVWRRLLRSDW